MPPRAYPLSFTTEQRRLLTGLDRPHGWRLVSKEIVAALLPSQALAQKIDSAVMICAETSTGGIYLVFNCRRVEHRQRAVDQHPFAVIIHTTGASPYGVIVEHGDWPGRTSSQEPAFWDAIERSGVGNWFLSYPPTGASSGDLSTLPPGDNEAFIRAVSFLRQSSTG